MSVPSVSVSLTAKADGTIYRHHYNKKKKESLLYPAKVVLKEFLTTSVRAGSSSTCRLIIWLKADLQWPYWLQPGLRYFAKVRAQPSEWSRLVFVHVLFLYIRCLDFVFRIFFIHCGHKQKQLQWPNCLSKEGIQGRIWREVTGVLSARLIKIVGHLFI